MIEEPPISDKIKAEIHGFDNYSFRKDKGRSNTMNVREIEAKHILNRSKLRGDGYTINPYVGCQHACVYCYACFMKRFSQHDEPWGEFVDVKINAAELFVQDFRKVKDGEGAFIGSATDAYHPLESEYELTRKILQKIVVVQKSSLIPKEFSVSILTKSDLVLRDIDLLKQIPGAEVGFSVSMPDEKARRLFEPGAKPVERRVAALKTLRGEGIATFAFIAPILQGITDLPAIFESLHGNVAYVFGEALNRHCGNMAQVLRAVSQYDRDLRSSFEKTCKDRNYWNFVEQTFRDLAEKHGIKVAGFFSHLEKDKD